MESTENPCGFVNGDKFTAWIEKSFLHHYEASIAKDSYLMKLGAAAISSKWMKSIRKNKEMIFCFDSIMKVEYAKGIFLNMLNTVRTVSERTGLHPVAVHAGAFLRSAEHGEIDNQRQNKVLVRLERKLK